VRHELAVFGAEFGKHLRVFLNTRPGRGGALDEKGGDGQNQTEADQEGLFHGWEHFAAGEVVCRTFLMT
jgi:hypothetical protein